MLRGNVDLVLMDFRMPQMDGLEAARRIRQSEAVCGSRRVVIVAYTTEAVDLKDPTVGDSGIDDVLVKPCNLETVARCIAKWFPGAHTEQ